MLKIKRLLALVPALCLALCAAALSEADDPVAVRVGDFTYARSTVQGSLDSALELSEMLRGDMPSEAEKQARLQATIDSFVSLGVIENKLSEAGMNDLSGAELEELHKLARSKYEEFWQLLYQQMLKNGEAPDEQAVTDALEGIGYTQEAIFDEYMLETRQNRAIDLFCGDMPLTQAQVDAYYEEQFLGPDRADYRDDLERYESEILSNDSESFYTPEGYRYIRQIVLEYPEEAVSAVSREQTAMNRAAQSMTRALQNLTMAATKADSWTEALAAAKADYDRALEALNAAQTEYLDALRAVAQPLLRDTLDEIRRQFDLGIDFLSLANKYSTDRGAKNLKGEGYPFHPDSPNWPPAFAKAAAALEKPGDISDPVYTEQGVHILFYAGDVPSGDHVLTDEERELLNISAQRYYQLEKLNGMIEEWQADYEIETHPELLKY